MSGHPLDALAEQLKALVGSPINALSLGTERSRPGQRGGGKKVRVAGLVVSVRRRNTQRGPMASVLLEDNTGRIELTLFNNLYEDSQEKLELDSIIVVSGSLIMDDYRGCLAIRAG